MAVSFNVYFFYLKKNILLVTYAYTEEEKTSLDLLQLPMFYDVYMVNDNNYSIKASSLRSEIGG